MIYLDTHVVVWLYAGLVDKMSQPARDLINEYEVRISPIVLLELQYLYEIRRVTEDATTLIADLAPRIGLRVCDKDFSAVASRALALSWTRDPFDRLIVAHAGLHGNLLLSKDQSVLGHYAYARW